MVEIGAKIKELRVAKKMSQKELAEFLNVTPQAVSKWERNKSYPDLDTLLKLSEYFQISTDKLLGNAKPSFLEALFSKSKGGNTMDKPAETKTYPKGAVPKAVKIENTASILTITFDNGETRYLRSHLNKDHVDAFSPSKGKGKRALLMSYSGSYWMGSEIEIKPDGQAIVNGNDNYSPEELWYDSKRSIAEL